MFWAKNIQIWARIGGLGALQSGAKSPKSCFFHRFRLIKTSTGLQIAPKSLSQVGTVPTDLPAKEFLKKTDPSPSYGPKRDGGSRRDSRRPSRFPTNFTKTTMARSTVKISAQFKKGVNPHISTQVLGQKYPNLGENGRPGGAPKWREKSKKLFFSPFSTHKSLHRAANCSKITLPGGHSSH